MQQFDTPPSRPWGRTLHLIDLENLTGSPTADAEDVAHAVEQYQHLVRVRADDHAVIAMNANNPNMVFAAKAAWQARTDADCVVKVAHGPDGADNVLVASCDCSRVPDRYQRVVVGSGDHVFTDLVIDLRNHGTVAGVVSRPDGLARTLARASSFQRFIDITRAPFGDDHRAGAA